VTAGGLTVIGQGIITGDSSVTSGAVSVTASTGSLDAMSVFASAAGHTGTVIVGRAAAGEFKGNDMSLVQGSTVKFQVRSNGLTTVSAGGVVVANGPLVIQNAGMHVTGDTTTVGDSIVTGGSVSVLASQASGAALDVYSSHTSFTATGILGIVPAGATSGNLLYLDEGGSDLFQVDATGKSKLSKGDVQATAAPLTVTAGGLKVNAGSLYVFGDSAVMAGSVSVTSTSASAAALDVYACQALTANAIYGRLANGATAANALTLVEGTNLIFQVCACLNCCCFFFS
jgi:hypothetical protein